MCIRDRLLGEQLPTILAGAADSVHATGHHDPMWMPFYVLVVYIGLTTTRFLWVWVSLSLTIFKAGRTGGEELEAELAARRYLVRGRCSGHDYAGRRVDAANRTQRRFTLSGP